MERLSVVFTENMWENLSTLAAVATAAEEEVSHIIFWITFFLNALDLITSNDVKHHLT